MNRKLGTLKFQNFAWKIPRFYDMSWSLSIEEWFYLTLPFALLLIRRITKARMSDVFLIVIGLFCAFSVTARAVGAGVHHLGFKNEM